MPSDKPLMGIQAGAVSFADEGVDQVLDVLTERAGVNALFFSGFSMTRGTGGRQFPGRPLPDHGVQEYDNFIGGNFGRTHRKFYANTSVGDFTAADPPTAGEDWVEKVLAGCDARGVAFYPWVVETLNSWWPAGAPRLVEVDALGATTRKACYANPDYQGWMLGLVEDYIKSYPTVRGLMWGVERQGPLEATLLGRTPYCFCEHCVRRGRDEGVDVPRARHGLQVLQAWVQSVRRGSVPTDGYLVEALRILLAHPEILQWERLWFEQQQELHQAIYRTVKTIDPTKEVGFHIWHHASFSPIFRAQWDLSRVAGYSDWLKPVLYHHCAGARFQEYVTDSTSSWLGDLSQAGATDVLYQALGIDERPFDELDVAGWSADYVRRETQRAVQGTPDGFPIYPGIDVNIPSGNSPTTRGSVRDAVVGAFEGGAGGVILSRKYSEMHLDMLSGAGDALKHLGLR